MPLEQQERGDVDGRGGGLSAGRVLLCTQGSTRMVVWGGVVCGGGVVWYMVRVYGGVVRCGVVVVHGVVCLVLWCMAWCVVCCGAV